MIATRSKGAYSAWGAVPGPKLTAVDRFVKGGFILRADVREERTEPSRNHVSGDNAATEKTR